MARSDDLRERVVRAVVDERMSRNATANRLDVGAANAVRWVGRFKTKGGRFWVPDGRRSPLNRRFCPFNSFRSSGSPAAAPYLGDWRDATSSRCVS